MCIPILGVMFVLIVTHGEMLYVHSCDNLCSLLNLV